jgi:hypothetical protein
MNIEFLIRILTNRLTRLRDNRILAEANGDLERLLDLDADISETENTLNTLRAL